MRRPTEHLLVLFSELLLAKSSDMPYWKTKSSDMPYWLSKAQIFSARMTKTVSTKMCLKNEKRENSVRAAFELLVIWCEAS